MFPADDAKPASAHDSATASTSHSHSYEHLSQPRPTSPGSVVSDASVERLEQGAVDMTRAEMGVKQHVASEVKSLFRLARSVGLDRWTWTSGTLICFIYCFLHHLVIYTSSSGGMQCNKPIALTGYGFTISPEESSEI